MGALDRDFWMGAVDRLAAAFEEHEARLCGYDGAIGDGDHGTSMLRGFQEARKSLRDAPAGGPGDVIRRTGEAFLSNVGGVTGVVFGSLFLAAGEKATGEETAEEGAAALYSMFACGLAAVRKRCNAAEGDKTMVDALSPAVDALRAAAEAGDTAEGALAAAARAAEAGMNATVPLEARVGRARYQAGKGRGHVDAGAASVCLLFQVLADAVRNA